MRGEQTIAAQSSVCSMLHEVECYSDLRLQDVQAAHICRQGWCGITVFIASLHDSLLNLHAARCALADALRARAQHLPSPLLQRHVSVPVQVLVVDAWSEGARCELILQRSCCFAATRLLHMVMCMVQSVSRCMHIYISVPSD